MSDITPGERTGRGRRARDRWLSGDAVRPGDLGGSSELQNQLLFAADDLRESAFALGGIEAFLLAVEQLLNRDDPSREEVERLLGEHDLEQRIAEMDDVLASLVRSLRRVAAQLP